VFHGGGITIWSATAQLADLVVFGNHWGSGGGLFIYDSDDVSVTRTLFSNNVGGSSSGGGAKLESALNVSFDQVIFAENDGWNGWAGGVAMDSCPLGGELVFSNVQFVRNSGGYYAGGMMAAMVSISNALFVGNIGENSGGGLNMWGSAYLLDNIIFSGNSANDSGGGLFGDTAGLPVSNCAFIQNVSSQEGGGIHAHYSPLDILNTSLTNNQAGQPGGGIEGDYEPTTLYCNALDNTPDNYHGFTDPTGTDGNISVDPLYLDTSSSDPLEWDLHLDPSSPLVDAGDPTILDPDGSPSDIGAFGGPGADDFDLDWDGYPSWWQPGPYDYATYPALGWDCDDLNPHVYPGNGC